MKRLAQFLILLGMLWYISGCCSLAGYGIGRMADYERELHASIGPSHLQSLNVGANIAIKCTDSTKITGTYLGIAKMQDNHYSKRTFIVIDSELGLINLPVPGDTLHLLNEFWQASGGILVGYDCYFKGDTASYQIKFLSLDDSTISGINPGSCMVIGGGQSSSITGKKLANLFENNRIPLMSCVAIKTGYGYTHIPFDKIVRITKPEKTCSFLGLTVGIFADAYIAFQLLKKITDDMFKNLELFGNQNGDFSKRRP
jgi:hypothetical protein